MQSHTHCSGEFNYAFERPGPMNGAALLWMVDHLVYSENSTPEWS